MAPTLSELRVLAQFTYLQSATTMIDCTSWVMVIAGCIAHAMRMPCASMRRHTFALILEVSAHIGLWRMNAYKKEHRRVCPEEPET